VIATLVSGAFPLLAVLGSLFAYYFPQYFVELKSAIVPLLGVVMFGMGMTLTAENFRAVSRRPVAVVTGLCLQYGLMPLLGWAIGHFLGLPVQIIAGLILLGSCPGGTASNVICYLARGDVALSITLTAASTLMAILATPFLTLMYAGQMVPVPVVAMLVSILKIVVLPVFGGVLINHYFHDRLAGVKHFFPALSVAAIVLIISVIVALNRDQFELLGGGLVLAVVAHNIAGLVAGYLLTLLLTRDQRQARTLAIEVGMQNSGLAVALAMQYFSAMAALPAAFFSIWHNISGSVLATWWARRPIRRRD
jgi:BASS family bile acid:Na+ symporter